MRNRRRRHGAEFKAKIALEAIKGVKSINEIASQYEVHPSQIMTWKKQALKEVDEDFLFEVFMKFVPENMKPFMGMITNLVKQKAK